MYYRGSRANWRGWREESKNPKLEGRSIKIT